MRQAPQQLVAPVMVDDRLAGEAIAAAVVLLLAA